MKLRKSALELYIGGRKVANKYRDKVSRINLLTAELEAIYHRVAWKLGVSDSSMRVLYVIHEKGGDCLLGDICRESGISKQTINSALRKLESEEILYLEQHKGNSKRVCLTEKGKSYVSKTAALLFAAECSAFEDWTDEEVEMYLKLMEKYNLSLRRQIEKIEGERI